MQTYTEYRNAVVTKLAELTGWPIDEAGSAVGNVMADYNEGTPAAVVADDIIAAIEEDDNVPF